MKYTDKQLDEMLRNEESSAPDSPFRPDLSRPHTVRPDKPSTFRKRAGLINTAAVFLIIAIALSALLPVIPSSTDGPPVQSAGNDGQQGSTSQISDASHGETSRPESDFTQTAEWYYPGDVEFCVLSSQYTLRQGENGINIVEKKEGENGFPDGVPLGNLSAGIVDVTGLIGDSSHSGCTNLYFDIKTGELFCMSCFVKNSTPVDLTDDEIFVIDNGSTTEWISCAIFSKSTNTVLRRFVVSVPDGDFYAIPVLAANDIDTIIIPEQAGYLITVGERPDEDLSDVYLVNIKTGEYKNISSSYRTYGQVSVFGNGRYVLCTLKNELGQTYSADSLSAQLLIYDTFTGETFFAEGAFRRFDGEVLVTETKSGFTLCNLGGEMKKDISVAVRNGSSVMLYNSSDGKVIQSLSETAEAVAFSENGDFVYIYSSGDEYVRCYNVDSAEFFDISLDEAQCDEIAKLARTQTIIFGLYVSANGESLILNYRTTGPVQKPDDDDIDTMRSEISSKLIEIFHYDFATLGIKKCAEALSNAFEGVDAVVKEEFAKKLVFFKGDGFCCLRYNEAEASVDDYRNSKACVYVGTADFSRLFPVMYRKGDYYSTVNGSVAETEKYILSLFPDIKVAEMPVDPEVFWKDGKYSEQAANDYALSTEYILSHLDNIYFSPSVTGYGVDYYDISGVFSEILSPCLYEGTPTDDTDGICIVATVSGQIRLNVGVCPDGRYILTVGDNDDSGRKLVISQENYNALMSEIHRCFIESARKVFTTEKHGILTEFTGTKHLSEDDITTIAAKGESIKYTDLLPYECEVIVSTITKRLSGRYYALFTCEDGYLAIGGDNDGSILYCLRLDGRYNVTDTLITAER